MTALCCNADRSKKLHPLIISKFEKPHFFKCLRYYPCDFKLSKTDLVSEETGLPE
jgi:hypothetical protein